MKTRYLLMSFVLGLGLTLALLWLLGGLPTSVTVASVPHVPSLTLSEASVAVVKEGATNSTAVTLTHGPIVGAVTSSTAVIWARASQTATVQVEYTYVEDNQTITITFPFTATAVYSKDFAVKIELNGLEPSMHYRYNIVIDGQRQLTSPYAFETFSKLGEARDFTFVVIGDFWGRKPHRERIHLDNHTFQEADNENPAFVIIGGDFDHSDPTSTTVTSTIEGKREMFQYLYQCEPAKFTGTYTDSSCLLTEHILSKYPVAHTWDDHDYGANDSDRTYEYSRTSLMVLDEYFPVYEMSPDGLNAQYGLDGDWQRFSYAHADFFLLDSRSQRDPNYVTDGPAKSMLGIRQLNWLTRELSSSEATWKFILTPSVFNPTSGKVDSWAWFELERKRILEFIQTEGITGVVLISGDMHFGGIDGGANAGLPEMIVPAVNFEAICITNAPKERFPGMWSGGTYEKYKNCWGYGVVKVSTNPHRVELQIKDDTGAQRLKCELGPDYRSDCAVSSFIPTFLKYYQRPGGGAIRDALQTTDSGYIMVGYTDVYTSESKPLIAKADRNGDLEWAASVSGTFGVFNAVHFALPGYYVAGTKKPTISLSYGWMARFDTEGHLVRGYDAYTDAFGISLRTVSCQQAYILGGNIDTSENRGIQVMRMRRDTIEDQRTYSVTAQIDSRGGLRPTADWGYALVGYVTVSTTLPNSTTIRSDEQLFAMKLDSELEPQWARVYGDSSSAERGSGVVEIPGGGYIVVGCKEFDRGGHLDKDMWALRLDREGGIVWQNAYGGPYDDGGAFLALTRHQEQWDVMIAGDYGASHNDSDIWVVKLNSGGEVVSQYTYGTENVDSPRVIRPTRDGGFVGGGVWNLTNTVSLASGFPVLFKLNRNGNVPGCSYRSEAVYSTTSTTSPLQAISVTTYNSHFIVAKAAEIAQAIPITPTTVCEDLVCLSISKAGPSSALAGSLMIYTLTITNSGSMSATDLVITDTLPAYTRFVSADSGGMLVGDQVQWTDQAAPASGSLMVTFVVRVSSPLTSGSVITNAAYGATSAEGVSAVGSPVTTTVQSAPILGIAKIDTPDPVAAGGLLTYTIVVQNTGNADATGVVITDTIPISTTFVFADSGGSLAGDQVHWTGRTVPAGGSLTVRFAVQVSSALPSGATITNDDYGVKCDQVPAPVKGAAVNTTVTVERWQVYLPVVMRNHIAGR